MPTVHIISIKDPVVGPPGTLCDNYKHSKWVHRRRYVLDVLQPQLQRLFNHANLFDAVTDPDFVSGRSIVDGQAKLDWHGERFNVDWGGCIGCFLSHYTLWERCVATGETMLIVEDDARLPAEHEKLVVDCISEYASGPYPDDVLYLLAAIPSARIALRQYSLSHCNVLSQKLLRVRACGDLSGTASYVIRPNAAKVLLRRTKEVGINTPDGHIHRSLQAGQVGVLAMRDTPKGFMLNDHYADWNHTHDPLLTA